MRSFSLVGVFISYKTLQQRFGKVTSTGRLCDGAHGSTPLMAAVKSGEFEGAAALIAAKARLDLTNYRGQTAADFAKENPVPAFILQALQGDPAECERISSLALADSFFEI